eukprot:1240514-Rhodomonas_salina.2
MSACARHACIGRQMWGLAAFEGNVSSGIAKKRRKSRDQDRCPPDGSDDTRQRVWRGEKRLQMPA